jgi:hypothetical protein
MWRSAMPHFPHTDAYGRTTTLHLADRFRGDDEFGSPQGLLVASNAGVTEQRPECPPLDGHTD